MTVSWPHGHNFAFTVFDDTDFATVEKVKPVYDLLADLGIRTTKSVWVFEGEGTPPIGGSTCEDREYLEWVLSLQRRGFEVGLHNAAPTTSARERTSAAFDRFRELFGERRVVQCNHAACRENIYWGEARLSGWRRSLYNVLTRGRGRDRYRGHVEGDPLFWGDLCRERVSYVRNFVYDEINTLAVCPEMPYHDPRKPFVNYWFASTDGRSLGRFLKNFTFTKMDGLVEEGGLCVVYAHFACGFARDGKADVEFRRRLEYLAAKDGWFAPVSEVLDHLRGPSAREERVISPQGLERLESRWLARTFFGEGKRLAGKSLKDATRTVRARQ